MKLDIEEGLFHKMSELVAVVLVGVAGLTAIALAGIGVWIVIKLALKI